MSLHLESNPHIQIVNFEGQTTLRATDGLMPILELDIPPGTRVTTDLSKLYLDSQTTNVVVISTDYKQRPTTFRHRGSTGSCKDRVFADYSYTIAYRPDGCIASLQSRYSDTVISGESNITHESPTGRRRKYRAVRSDETRISIYEALPQSLRRLDVYYHHLFPDLGVLDHAEFRAIETEQEIVAAVSAYYECARFPGADNIINLDTVPVHKISGVLENDASQIAFARLPHMFYLRTTITPTDIEKWADGRAEPAYFVGY